MNKDQPSKLADEIYHNIVERINEALNKNNWNPAYEIAFCVGLRYDIDEILIKNGIVKK